MVHVIDVQVTFVPISGSGKFGQFSGITAESCGLVVSLPGTTGTLDDRVKEPNRVSRNFDSDRPGMVFIFFGSLKITLPS
jgi:hypothetical protein